MTEERIDALVRLLDVAATPDPAFVSSSLRDAQARVQAARASDSSFLGRLGRDLRLAQSAIRAADLRIVRAVGVVALLLLAAIAVLAAAAALIRPPVIQNGALVVAAGGQVDVVEADGSTRTILPSTTQAFAISRSPDGRSIAYWVGQGDRRQLHVVGVDGTNDRGLLALDSALGSRTKIDTWSWDSRFLATEVRDSGFSRILIVDVGAGVAHYLTPRGPDQHNPLWSPDGRSIAFTEIRALSGDAGSLDIIDVDGSGLRTLSPTADGPDTWSADGQWIYFDTGRQVMRVNAASGTLQMLIPAGPAHPDGVFAPASSPDGTRIAFISARPRGDGFDLWGANSDGSAPRLLLAEATNDGWSGDGKWILGQWMPKAEAGGLVLVSPETGDFRVVYPFTVACQATNDCVSGVGWGQARP